MYKPAPREIVWKKFGAYGVRGLAKSNGLNEEENLRLFQTFVLDEAIQTVLMGLGRVRTVQE
jgi:hypothetical protein